MNTTFTVEQLQGMNSTELRKAATKLGVKSSSRYIKGVLLDLAIAQISDNSDSETNSELDTVRNFDLETANMDEDFVMATYHASDVSKSEKFRKLHNGGKGLRIIEISKLFKSPYSFVYGVIDRQRNKSRQEKI